MKKFTGLLVVTALLVATTPPCGAMRGQPPKIAAPSDGANIGCTFQLRGSVDISGGPPAVVYLTIIDDNFNKVLTATLTIDQLGFFNESITLCDVGDDTFLTIIVTDIYGGTTVRVCLTENCDCDEARVPAELLVHTIEPPLASGD